MNNNEIAQKLQELASALEAGPFRELQCGQIWKNAGNLRLICAGLETGYCAYTLTGQIACSPIDAKYAHENYVFVANSLKEYIEAGGKL